jgi:hypothetical protein
MALKEDCGLASSIADQGPAVACQVVFRAIE